MSKREIWDNDEFWTEIESLRTEDDDGLFDCTDSAVVVHPRSARLGSVRSISICTKLVAREALLEIPREITGPIWLASALMGEERASFFCSSLNLYRPLSICFFGDPDPIDLVCYWNICRLAGPSFTVSWIDLAAMCTESDLSAISIEWAEVERRVESVFLRYQHNSPLALVHRGLWRTHRKVELEGVLGLVRSSDALLSAMQAVRQDAE